MASNQIKNPQGYTQFSQIKKLNKSRINKQKMCFWLSITFFIFPITIGILHYYIFNHKKLVKEVLMKKFKKEKDIIDYIKWNNEVEEANYNKYNFKEKFNFWIRIK